MTAARVTWAVLALLAASLAGVLADASARRAARDGAGGEARARAEVLASGGADLALSSSSRWLRHPQAAEPGAAFADAPAALDVDPAALLVPPPRAVFGASSRDVARKAR